MLKNALRTCGLVGILRGLPPEDAAAIATILYGTGFRILEVPLNSPHPLVSISRIRSALPGDCLVGAGTVFHPSQVEDVRKAGAEFVVMPHFDSALVQIALQASLEVLPGVATPSEAFAALSAGATLLKAFPASEIGIAALKAWLAVLPDQVSLVPVGGITSANMHTYYADRVIGFGLGSALYAPSITREEVRRRALDFVSSWNALRKNVQEDAR